jgi:hypothetical protein
MIRRLARRRRARFAGPTGDYRLELFEELRAYREGQRPRRILEIGPKDGLDSARLLGLEPERLTLVDLPGGEESNQAWLHTIASPALEYVTANIMYSQSILRLPPFDLPSALAVRSCLQMVGEESSYYGPDSGFVIGKSV